MIGNDIVDLGLARKESHWRRKGFLEKVFTTHEQQLIHTATNPDLMVWLLWSIKESTYKAAVRNNGKRRFAPAQLACDLTRLDAKNAAGAVSYEEKEYLTTSLCTEDYVATVSTNKKLCNISFDHILVPFDKAEYLYQHTILWEKVKQYGAAALCVPEEEISFHKDETGVPRMMLPSGESLPLSVSHHGRFGAFVIGCQAQDWN